MRPPVQFSAIKFWYIQHSSPVYSLHGVQWNIQLLDHHVSFQTILCSWLICLQIILTCKMWVKLGGSFQTYLQADIPDYSIYANWMYMCMHASCGDHMLTYLLTECGGVHSCLLAVLLSFYVQSKWAAKNPVPCYQPFFSSCHPFYKSKSSSSNLKIIHKDFFLLYTINMKRFAGFSNVIYFVIECLKTTTKM